MTEKITITQEQSEALIAVLSTNDRVKVLHNHANLRKWFGAGHKPVLEIPFGNLARILYEPNSYQVEPEYKVGDWVVSRGLHFGKIDAIINAKFIGTWFNEGRTDRMECEASAFIRHATPEEIKAEKERQKWAGIEEGDVLIGLILGRLAAFIQRHPEHGEIAVKTQNDNQELWDVDSCELYAKKVGEPIAKAPSY